MPDEDQSSSATEIAEAVAQPQQSEPQVRQEEAQASARKRNDAEYNWAEARRKQQELERKLKEQDEYIKNLQKPKEEDELDQIADDEIVTKAQVKKLAAKMAQEIAGQVIKQREAQTVNERLQLKYSDYDAVVTPENIEFLKQTEPELALSLYHNPDPYAQGVAAYKLLKKIGTSSQPDSVEKKKALENVQKPVSVNAAAKGSSAIGNAHLFENGLTPELKKSLWAEMQKCVKGA